MPPKKKNVPRTGYYMFMSEVQEEMRKKGIIKSMEQMRAIVAPQWNQLSVSQKDKYNAKAKIHKKELRHTQEKLASDGTSIRANEMQQLEIENKKKKMILEIEEYINAHEENVEIFKDYAKNRPIYIASFNILCCTNEGVYIPLEIAIVEYTIKRGICRVFHKFIHPGQVPTGYQGEAKRHADASHKIPSTGHKDSIKNYNSLVRDIHGFLSDNQDQKLFPIFCQTEAIEQTVGCFEWLCEMGGIQQIDMFQVYDLSELLFNLRSKVGDSMPSALVANSQLSKNIFDYAIGTRCDYHEDLDSPYCALGCSQRLCFLFSDLSCRLYDVEETSKHLPNRAEEIKPYEIHYPAPAPFEHECESNFRPSSVNSQRPMRRALEEDLSSVADDDLESMSSFSSMRQPKPLSITNEIAKLSVNAPTTINVGIGRGRIGN